ncbi:MAG TPA: hypothetical protein ENJ53_04025 [Phaeodactylibacter sp.]|nr:hypothetical protein [Phaeodactylibacter sp.]
MKNQQLSEEIRQSELYSPDLAPTPEKQRSWKTGDLAAIWVGMAVCIPTYLLASYMIKDGLNWLEALIIIALGNIIVTIPMVLNGHAGVKYGVPFPVIGRASFGIKGIHIASVVRGIVACGWFGIQTWIGGLAIYSIGNVLLGNEGSLDLTLGKFIGFILFWLINVFFIWKGTESIRWLEKLAAPLLIGIGVLMIVWGAKEGGGFSKVLEQSNELAKATATFLGTDNNETVLLKLHPLKDLDGWTKADAYQLSINNNKGAWQSLRSDSDNYSYPFPNATEKITPKNMTIQFKKSINNSSTEILSTAIPVKSNNQNTSGSKIWKYLLWLTAMVGFWGTMAISIADITRYTRTQKEQILGQFIGLPGTMVLYSFVGVFVTCAAVLIFPDILIVENAPWDPVSLLDKFKTPWIVITAQLCMLIATLSTNIAANVIAPANAFSNLAPRKISFRMGGLITAMIGIVICPWWLMDEISSLLLFVSSFLGPVLGVLICDYFSIRKKELSLNDLFLVHGKYSYYHGFNITALIALLAGVVTALVGLYIPALSVLYTTSWFSGFIVSYLVYYFLSKKKS